MSRKLKRNNINKFKTGAIRSKDAEGTRFDLISPIGLRRLAARYHLGSVNYAPNNWLKGFPASDTLQHALNHLNLWFAGDTTEDHLAAAAWGLFAVMHFEETRPDLIDVPSRPEYNGPDVFKRAFRKINNRKVYNLTNRRTNSRSKKGSRNKGVLVL